MNRMSPLSQYWNERLQQFLSNAKNTHDHYTKGILCRYAVVCRTSMEMALAIETVQNRVQ